ncbi:MAG TPA: DUF6132 family protein [Bacteroidota bacterium]
MNISVVSSVLAGGGLGYLYYRFVGCKTGTCPITRNPWISTIYGMLIGLMIATS